MPHIGSRNANISMSATPKARIIPERNGATMAATPDLRRKGIKTARDDKARNVSKITGPKCVADENTHGVSIKITAAARPPILAAEALRESGY